MGSWIYLAVAVLGVWPLSRVVARVTLSSPTDPVERGFDAAVALVAAAVWPFVLVAVLAWKISKTVWERLLGVDDRDRQRVP